MPPLSDDPCNDPFKNGANDLRSSGLPAEFRAVPPKPCVPVPTSKPPCAKCRNKNQPKGKYIQPEVPASYKPEGRYKPPCYPLESGTIYKLSYPGVEGDMMKDCKPKRTFVSDNIRPSEHPFSQDTTFRLSFTGVQGERSVSYKPPIRSMMGSGPMQSMTTQRHDFVPKVSERPIPQKTNNNIYLSSAKMENATTMMLSYQPVEGEKVVSFKPHSTYKKSDYKLEQDTINRLSYQPWEATPKEVYPWMKREQYKAPTYTMEGHTIYRASYMPVENFERLPPFKPPQSVSTMGPDKPLASATIYKESYQDNGVISRPEPFKIRENIYLSTQPMSQDTTARLSYTGVVGEKAIPYKPLYRSMMGAGPMQSITTQRHDYVPKPIIPVESYKPQQVMSTPNFKMDDMTTFRASYQPNEGTERVQSCRPTTIYKKSSYPLESDTINRLSYQPYEPLPKEDYPWMKKARYQQPTRGMDNTSIYRGSYLAPGNYVPDGSGADDECDCQRQQQTTTATDDL